MTAERRVPMEPTQYCPACGGAGEYWDGPTEAPERRQCDACYGTGLLDAAPPQAAPAAGPTTPNPEQTHAPADRE